MSTQSNDGNGTVHVDVHASGQLTNAIAAALRKAVEQGRPFILPWRQRSEAKRPAPQMEGDASCGSGPID